MKPRAIEVHIEELVLHGFAPGARSEMADALQHELRGLLIAHGIPPAWQASPQRIDAGAVRANSATKASLTGEQVARAVFSAPVQ